MPEGQKAYSQGVKPLGEEITTITSPKRAKEKRNFIWLAHLHFWEFILSLAL